MKDIMSSRGGFASRKISGLSGGDDDINTSIWTTLRFNKLIEEIDNGLDIKGLHNSPFKDNDINLKRAQLPFEYTPDEWNELVKCKEDILYFAYNHCYIQTNKGIMLIKDAGGLRDFQEQILLSFKANKYNILMASRQIGKSVTSAIFILWFSLFHAEKTFINNRKDIITAANALICIAISPIEFAKSMNTKDFNPKISDKFHFSSKYSNIIYSNASFPYLFQEFCKYGFSSFLLFFKSYRC
jgi:hypothetical protein